MATEESTTDDESTENWEPREFDTLEELEDALSVNFSDFVMTRVPEQGRETVDPYYEHIEEGETVDETTEGLDIDVDREDEAGVKLVLDFSDNVDEVNEIRTKQGYDPIQKMVDCFNDAAQEIGRVSEPANFFGENYVEMRFVPLESNWDEYME